MSKKKIILSQRQLDEICGGNSTYLDGLALSPDIGNVFSNEVSTDGAIENGYPLPTTTDDYADVSTNNNRGFWSLRGMGSIHTIREMTKGEWEANMLSEENERLLNRNFGATNDSEGKGYYATLKNKSRYENAKNTVQSGTPEEKRKALKTIERMKKNWPGIDVAINQYETAKKVDKTIKPRMKSAPKNSGNGKAHSPKNGVFIN